MAPDIDRSRTSRENDSVCEPAAVMPVLSSVADAARRTPESCTSAKKF